MRFPPLPPVVKNLLIINVLLCLVMMFSTQIDEVFTRVLGLHYVTNPHFNPAQFFTYMFLHANLAHLFFNMFALVMFGGVIEKAMGSKRFLIYYVACGLVAALVQQGVYALFINHYESLAEMGTLTLDDIRNCWFMLNAPMVGASGAIFGILLAFGMLYPNAPIYIFFVPYPVKAKWVVIGYGALELLQGLGGVADNVAHFAHLGGMIAGIILIIWWKRKGVFRNGWFF